MDEQLEKILSEQKKLVASNLMLKRWVAALTLALVASVVVLGVPEYRREKAQAAAKEDLKNYLQANPMYLTTPSDVKNPTKGATFPVYKYTP